MALLSTLLAPGFAEAMAIVLLPPALAASTWAVWLWLEQDARVNERARANRRRRLRLKSMVSSLARNFRAMP